MNDLLDDLWKARHQKDNLFLSIIEGYTLKESKEYSDEIFYTKDDKVLINFELITNNAYINHDLIWSVFQSKFSLNDDEIIKSMKDMLETHLKLEGTTPDYSYWLKQNSLITELKLQEITDLALIKRYGNIR